MEIVAEKQEGKGDSDSLGPYPTSEYKAQFLGTRSWGNAVKGPIKCPASIDMDVNLAAYKDTCGGPWGRMYVCM